MILLRLVWCQYSEQILLDENLKFLSVRLESQNKAKNNISVGLPIKLPNQNFRRIGPGVIKLWSDKQTDRQTENTTLYV